MFRILTSLRHLEQDPDDQFIGEWCSISLVGCLRLIEAYAGNIERQPLQIDYGMAYLKTVAPPPLSKISMTGLQEKRTISNQDRNRISLIQSVPTF